MAISSRQCTVWILALASLLAAARSGLADEPGNAAAWYQRAIARLHVLTEDDWVVINAYRDDPAVVSPRLREVLAKAGPMLNDFRRAANLGYADYHLDYSQGYALALPHLAQVRSVARIMQADAYLHLADGDTIGAAQRIGAMYQAAGHLADDRTMISSLVGRAMYEAADGIVQSGLDHAAIDAAGADLLARSLSALEGRDPFGIRESVAGEKALVFDYLSVRFETEEGRAEVREMIPEEMAGAITAMTDEEFYDSLDQYDGLMDDIVVAFNAEDRADGTAALAQISKDLEEGKYGLLAQAMTPAFARVYELMADTQEAIARRQATLEQIARGEIDPAAESNAALDYARAVAAVRRLDDEQRRAIRDFEAGADDEGLAERAAAALEAAAEAIEIAQAASVKRRCDFTLLAPRRAEVLCPDYAAGMHELLVLLRANARRRLGSTDPDADAVRALAVNYRVMGHLAGDGHVMSALVSHHAFGRTTTLVEAPPAQKLLDDDDRITLAAAARRIGRADPFGYLAALEQMRGPLRGRVRTWNIDAGDAAAVQRFDAAMAHLAEWDGDRLLYLVATYDALADGTPPSGDAPGAGGEPVRQLGDVIDLDGFDEARAQLPVAAAMIARQELDVFGELGEWPRFGRVEERRRAARGDLRAGNALFRTSTETETDETEAQTP